MRRLLASSLLAIGLAACGSKSSGSVDGPGGTVDTAIVPATIMITGTASAIGIGTMNLEGVTVQAFHNGDDTTVVATGTSGSDGMYSVMITTNGVPLDGYLKATKDTYMTTYLYPSAPLAADYSGASVKMVTPGTFSFLSSTAGGGQLPGMGFVAIVVDDSSAATAMPVAGASVSSAPAAESYRYNGPDGLPRGAAVTMTAADGIGYMFNLAPGQVTVSATKAGSTFKSHPVTAWADAITTTIVTP